MSVYKWLLGSQTRVARMCSFSIEMQVNLSRDIIMLSSSGASIRKPTSLLIMSANLDMLRDS